MSWLRNFFVYIIFFTFVLFLSPAVAEAADRYWVGGTGNWSDATNHWSDTSGGAPNASFLPTAVDDVFFDTNSSGAGYTVTIDATTKVMHDLTFSAPATGDVTWAGSVAMTVSGSMTLYPTLAHTYSGTITFDSGSSETIDTAGASVSGIGLVFNNVDGTWTLMDDWLGLQTSNVLTVTAGSFITNGYAVTIGRLSTSGSEVRSIILGSSVITVASSQGLAMTSTTNLTFDAGTSSITSGSISNNLGTGLTYYDLTFTNGSGHTLTGSATARNISFSGGNFHDLVGDLTSTGILTLSGVSASTRTSIRSSPPGVQRTITAASVVLTNGALRDIVGAGAADWDLSGDESGDLGNNSNIIFTTPANVYWVGDGGNWNDVANWSVSSGGAGGFRIPLPQDTAIFDENSFSVGGQIVTVNMFLMSSMDFSDVTNSPTLALGTQIVQLYGSIILSPSMSVTGTTTRLYYYGSGTGVLTTSGVAWPSTHTSDAISVNASGSLTLGSALSMSSGHINIVAGTFNDGNFNVTVKSLGSTGASSNLVMGIGLWTIVGDVANIWNFATTASLTSGTSTIKLTGALTAARNFAGGGKTYYNVENATTGAFALNVTGSNTFNNFHIDASAAARTVKFTAGTTQTIGSLTRDAGTNVITIDGVTTGTHTLTKSGGGTVSLDYLNIQHSIATPSNTWFAGLNSTDNQAVVTAGSGWLFTDFPPDAPTALGPTEYVSGSTTQATNPNLTFTLSDQNLTDTLQYRIQIDDTADFSSPEVDYTSALAAQGATAFTVGQAEGAGTYTAGAEAQTLTDASYYVRVQAIDQATAESSYATANSGSVAFIISTPPGSISGSRRNPTQTTTVVTTPTQPVTTLPMCLITISLLKISSRGTDVSCLQQKLNILLPTNLVTDGIFGPLTKQAVVNFQTKNSLAPDGIVGPLTRAFLK